MKILERRCPGDAEALGWQLNWVEGLVVDERQRGPAVEEPPLCFLALLNLIRNKGLQRNTARR